LNNFILWIVGLNSADAMDICLHLSIQSNMCNGLEENLSYILGFLLNKYKGKLNSLTTHKRKETPPKVFINFDNLFKDFFQ